MKVQVTISFAKVSEEAERFETWGVHGGTWGYMGVHGDTPSQAHTPTQISRLNVLCVVHWHKQTSLQS